jgi:hypothetical protein
MAGNAARVNPLERSFSQISVGGVLRPVGTFSQRGFKLRFLRR